MAFNSVDNFEEFAKWNFDFCKLNNIKNFTIWSNGKDLQCTTGDNDIASVIQRGQLKSEGYWKCVIVENGNVIDI